MSADLSSVVEGWYQLIHPGTADGQWVYKPDRSGPYRLWIGLNQGVVVSAIGTQFRPVDTPQDKGRMWPELLRGWRESVSDYGTIEELLAAQLGLVKETNIWEDDLILEA